MFYFTGIYKRVWSFARAEDLLALVSSLLITALALVSISYFYILRFRVVFLFLLGC